ncbi:MAG: DNA/RNA non-specific endonuclease [Mogibacterium sp.]|nr:DNA/RNA non-specific endonuclease [Mogibacterium sp.]
MAKASQNNKNTGDRSRQRPALALLLAFLIAAAFFILSDVSFVKSARDSLMQKLGYEAIDQGDSNESSGENSSAENSDVIPAEWDVTSDIDPAALPEYNGQNYVKVSGGTPVFPDEVCERAGLIKDGDDWKTQGNLFGTVDSNKLTPYECYGSPDDLGRCTYAFGLLGEETMPQEGQERGDISPVHPSGWAKAQNWERCHLIAWALSAENANPSNLITGTHYLNYDGMRPLEEEVEHYIWDTGNHVLYYIKPWFKDDELVARGVQMTAWSVEDKGEGISFNVYCFNVTPGAEIDYRTGIVTTEEQAAQDARVYVINTRSGVFHYPTCDGVKEMSEHNKKTVTATRTELTSQGYTPCGACEP